MAYDRALGTADNWSQIIYVDGVKRRCTGLGSPMYIDSDDLPRRRCSEHRFSWLALDALKSDGTIRTNGHVYSLRPPRKEA